MTTATASPRRRSPSKAPAKTPARPRARKPKPTPIDLEALKISPEVGYYLTSRGYPMPTCVPKFKTPEPRTVRGAVFDELAVDRVIESMRLMRHTQGKWAGRPLEPDPWQVAYIIAPVYGWKRPDGHGGYLRIIRTQYVELPRKNGKTTLAGGQAMYLTAADGEEGGQVLAAAAGKDQAGYCFRPVRAIAEKSPGLTQHVQVYAGKIIHKRTGSYFAVASSVADLLHGANIHGAIIDELHIHKTRDLVDALETGTGARDQPMIVLVTTADDGKPGTIYAEKRSYVERLSRRVITDPTFYGVIFAADETDDPHVEATWRKANPGYGISPTKAFLESESRKARQSPANLSRFLRLHLGLRTKQETKFITLPVWDRNAGMVDERALAGRSCYGGLDLASTSDLCAFGLLFPDELDGFDVIVRLWAPEGAMQALNNRTARQADVWRREGFLTVTPGDVADYDYIREQINRDREHYVVTDIGYDAWNSSQLVNDLVGDGATMTPIRQGFVSLSAPTKAIAHKLLEGTAKTPKFRHGGNPALRWQVDNLAVAVDPAGNVKPDKAHSGDKIDGFVSLVIAMARALTSEPEGGSIYESRDMIVL